MTTFANAPTTTAGPMIATRDHRCPPSPSVTPSDRPPVRAVGEEGCMA